MKSLFKRGLKILILIHSISPLLIGQETGDNIVLSAMMDELENNFNNLNHPEYENPFYISYNISDGLIYSGKATLGAIINSSLKPFKSSNTRVMVGNYRVNDENYRDITNPVRYNYGNIPLPIDDDYWGIRRSLWLTTDIVYKAAGHLYKSKIEALKNTDYLNDSLFIPDFSKEFVVIMNINRQEYNIDKNQLEELIRVLSSVFKDYGEIAESSVSVLSFKANNYFVNSEGTIVQSPLDITALTISASCIGDGFGSIYNYIDYYRKNPSELPDKSTILIDIRNMIEKLIELKNAPVIQPGYNGPILCTNDASACIFSSLLFGRGGNSLRAIREQLYNDAQMNIYYGRGRYNSNIPINQRILPKTMSVKATPHLEEYAGNQLIGSFHVDAEGVVPPEELILIDHGILKTFLNGRTPTRTVTKSNGHNRYNISYNLAAKIIAPGVVQIQAENGKSYEDLKQELIKIAREDNLEYALVIKKVHNTNHSRPLFIYKIDTKDGSEKLVRMNAFIQYPEDCLKRILGTTVNPYVYNTISFGRPFISFEGWGMMPIDYINVGVPASYITPDAVLFENLEISSYTNPISISQPIVENPVK